MVDEKPSAFKFTGHAVRKMFARAISREEVLGVLANGEAIAEYPDDRPHPSKLILGRSGDRPLHVVAALDGERATCYIVTVYEPDPSQWDAEFRRRLS